MQTYIISLGGSLIAPDGVDVAFLKKFRAVLLKESKRNKFIIIPGGGQTCRNYQKAARAIAKVSNDDLDWIGIATNLLHTNLLRAIFGKSKNIIVERGGLAPGGTSDSTAVRFAEEFRAKTIVNLTNVAGVYDRDPRKFKNARLITRMAWAQLKSQFGTGKTPGRNLPFDSAIAGKAAKLGLQVVILDGHNLKNFQIFLVGRSFKGTVIQ